MPTKNSSRTIVQIEGCNGSWFTLSGPGMGKEGVFLGTNVEGIYDAPVKTIYTEHANQIGASFAGVKNLKRDVVFGVTIGDTDNSDWQKNDSEWRKAWSYTKDSKLWIETNDSRRYLKLRLAEQPVFRPERDPNLMQVERVGMTCVAADPWWYEEDATGEWISKTGKDSGVVAIENPTDQEVWLKWIFQGPGSWTIPDFSFGDDRFENPAAHANRGIQMPAMLPGAKWVVDTDPMEDTLRDINGSQIWSLMRGKDFLYPIPPYTERTELPVSVTGSVAGAGIQVRIPRTWSRPWGLQ